MNAIQYYIVDTFLKGKVVTDIEGERFADEERNELMDDDEDPHGALLEGDSRSDIDPDSETRTSRKVLKSSSRSRSDIDVKSTEYDPAVDGENTLPESSSRTNDSK